MSKKYKLSQDGKFFVEGKGFVGTAANASLLDEGKVKCVAGLGFNFQTVEAVESYAIVYIRKGEGVKLLAGYSKDKADANKGQIDPSKRRFATFDEANHHGSRFAERRAKRTDKPGTAGHEGYFVIETSDAVNSKVNWKSGLTNPV